MYRTFNMSANGPHRVFVHCAIRSTKTVVLTNRMHSVVFVITNLKHTHFSIPHFVVIITLPFIGPSHLFRLFWQILWCSPQSYKFFR
jgi:hypothetical protein